MVQRSRFRPVDSASPISVQTFVAISIIAIVALLAIWASWREYQRANGSSDPVAEANSVASPLPVVSQLPITARRDSKAATRQPIAPQSDTTIKELPRRNSLGIAPYVLTNDSSSKQATPKPSPLSASKGVSVLLVNDSQADKDPFRETFPSSELAAATPAIEDLADVTDDAHPFEQTIQQIVASHQAVLPGRTLESAQLISLNRFGSIRVIVGDRPPTMQQLASINVGTRRPESFEFEAIERFKAGESTVVKSSPADVLIVSAIRVEQSCQRCHTHNVGDLIGAISIRHRTPGQRDPDNVFDAL